MGIKQDLVNEVFAVGLCTSRTPTNERFYANMSTAELRWQVDMHKRYEELRQHVRADLSLSHLGNQHPHISKPCTTCGEQVGEWFAFHRPAVERDHSTYYPNMYARDAAGEWVVNHAEGYELYCLACATR